MPRHAFILGGTGQIGRAVAARLLDEGGTVTVASRGGRPVGGSGAARHLVLDRDTPGALSKALAGGADALIDTVAYDAAHATQLIEVGADVGAFAVISSAAVYCDAEGRSLYTAGQSGFPEFAGPIAEQQSTVAPGSETYAHRKVALEHTLTDASGPPTTILRPCAIHGPYSTHPREWWFVKRMLDARPAIPLNYRGESVFHTSAATNIAALVSAALEKPATRILNSGDPEALTTNEIGSAIARRMAWAGKIHGLDIDDETGVGDTPWSAPRPFILDLSAGATVGYRPATTYEAALPAMCDWLLARKDHDWKALYPVMAGYPRDPFDYAAEVRR